MEIIDYVNFHINTIGSGEKKDSAAIIYAMIPMMSNKVSFIYIESARIPRDYFLPHFF